MELISLKKNDSKLNWSEQKVKSLVVLVRNTEIIFPWNNDTVVDAN